MLIHPHQMEDTLGQIYANNPNLPKKILLEPFTTASPPSLRRSSGGPSHQDQADQLHLSRQAALLNLFE
jgi:hypothetical protein